MQRCIGCFFILLVSGSVFATESTQPKLLFSLNFDNNSLMPQVAGGDSKPEVGGTMRFAPGFKGSAAIFKNGNFVRFKAPGNFNRYAGTIEMRFKMLPAINNNYRRHLLTFYTNESERWYLRQITKDTMMTYGFGTGGFPFFDNPAGAWHHIALCWKQNADKKTRHVTVYLDGRKVVDKNVKSMLPAFTKGYIILGSYDKGVNALNGLLDEFKIYDDVVYTQESYPELFIYPTVTNLEKRLSRIKRGVDVIPNSVQKQDAEKIYAQLSERLGKLKDGSVKEEAYFEEYARLDNELNKFWESSAASALWWKGRKAKSFEVLPISCMQKISDRWTDAPRKSELPKLTSARHEWSAFQLVVLPLFKDIRNCTVKVDTLTGQNGTIADSNIKIFTVGTVGQKGDLSRWADPIVPLKGAFSVKAERIQPIWIQVYVPKGTAPGRYCGKVTVAAEGVSYEFPVTMKVYDFTLPVKPRLQTAFGFAMTPLVNYYKVKDYKPIAKKYLANMLEHKVSIKTLWLHGIYYDTTFLAPKIIKTRSGKWKMDFTDYDRQLDELLPLGLNTIMVGYRSWDGNFRRIKDKTKAVRQFPYYDEADINRVKKLTLPVLSSETEKFGKFVIKTWYDHLKERHLEDMAYTYFVDEPSADMMGMINTICGWAHDVAPALKNMITHVPVKSCPNVDIWCPLAITPTVLNYVKSGGTIWKYVCCAPLSPHPNFFINQTALENRLPFWEAYKAGAKGFAYYETGRSLYLSNEDNVWSSLRWAGSPGTEGDGFLVYPGKDGPINTIRFEYVRMGIQDVEYFLMLKEMIKKLPKGSKLRKQAEKLLVIDNNLLKNSAAYSKDWKKYQRRKHQVGLMIEKIR